MGLKYSNSTLEHYEAWILDLNDLIYSSMNTNITVSTSGKFSPTLLYKQSLTPFILLTLMSGLKETTFLKFKKKQYKMGTDCISVNKNGAMPFLLSKLSFLFQAGI